MNIIISSGQGTGKTLLSAFDGALFDAGVSNYNLLVLSSIIPPHSTIIQQKFVTPEEEYGHKLYVVMSENRSNVNGVYIGAAVGWCQEANGQGLFVEHHVSGNSLEAVTSQLDQDVHDSLSDLCRLRGFSYTKEKVHMQMSTMQVKDTPSCALVVAVYQAESWETIKS